MKNKILAPLLLLIMGYLYLILPLMIFSAENITSYNNNTETETEIIEDNQVEETETQLHYSEAWILSEKAMVYQYPDENSNIIDYFVIGDEIYVTQYSDEYLLTNDGYVKVEDITYDEYTLIIKKADIELTAINQIKDKQEWFIQYKEIIHKYQDYIDPPESIYDYYTQKEIELLCKVVQAECGDYYGFDAQCNIVSVIFNHIDHPDYPNTMKGVLFKKNAFSTVSSGRYKRQPVTEQALLACEYVFMMGDTTDGCIAFRSDKKPKTWYGWKYQFTDNSGTHYYK